MVMPLEFCMRQGMIVMRLPWMLAAVVAIVLVATPANARRSEAAEPSQGDPAIRALVRQLGDPLYAVRERSERQLEQIGIATERALIGVLNDPDAELRYRARRVLIAVREADRHRRIAIFARSAPGSGGQGLPAWALFKQVVGDDHASRNLFLQAIRAEPALLEAVERGADPALKALRTRITKLTQVLTTGRRVNLALGGIVAQNSSLRPADYQGNAVAFLLAYADPDIPDVPEVTIGLFQLVVRTNLTSFVASRAHDEPYRPLLGSLILRSENTQAAYQALQWSLAYQFKEGLVPALAILRTPNQTTQFLFLAVLAVGKLGEEQHIALLEPLLKDERPLRRTSKAGALQQVRDVALAMSVHLSGQDLAKYGFKRAQKVPSQFYNAQTLAFASDAERQKAMQRWKAWVARSKSASDPSAKTGGES